MLSSSPKTPHFPSLYNRRSLSPTSTKFARVIRLHNIREKYWKDLETKIKEKHELFKNIEENTFNKSLLKFQQAQKNYQIQLPNFFEYQKPKKIDLEDHSAKHKNFENESNAKNFSSIPRSQKKRSSVV
jgi:hypothetical protein